MRVDEDGALEKSTDIIKLLVHDLIIYMENTGGDASCLNEKNERNSTIINNMVRSGTLDSIQREKNSDVHQKHHNKSIYIQYQ